MKLGLILNGCGGDDRDYDDEHMMVHDDDGDGDGSATDDDDVLFFKVEPALIRCNRAVAPHGWRSSPSRKRRMAFPRGLAAHSLNTCRVVSINAI